MIKWCENPYLDEALTPKWEKIKKRLEREKPAADLYCITFPSNPENLLDIYNCNELLFKYYKRRDIYAIGMARGRKNAILLVKEMVEDMYQDTGEINPREYFIFPE